MGHRPKHKMSQADRAKQFMPFAALKGYEEALRAKEEEILSHHAEPKILYDDAAEGTYCNL